MVIQEINRAVIEQFRAGGEIEGMQRDRLMLLTTVGRRTRQHRTTPMMYRRDGDGLLVIASNVGAPQHPDWYLNLVAEPHVTVEVDAETYDASATRLAGNERDRMWTILKQAYPFFSDHEAATTRTIPGSRVDQDRQPRDVTQRQKAALGRSSNPEASRWHGPGVPQRNPQRDGLVSDR